MHSVSFIQSSTLQVLLHSGTDIVGGHGLLYKACPLEVEHPGQEVCDRLILRLVCGQAFQQLCHTAQGAVQDRHLHWPILPSCLGVIRQPQRLGSHTKVQLREDSRQSTPACTTFKISCTASQTIYTRSINGSHRNEKPAKGDGTLPVSSLMFSNLQLPALAPLEDVFQSRVTISRSRCSSRSGSPLASLIACFK